MISAEQKAIERLCRGIGALILGRMAELSIGFDDIDQRLIGTGSQNVVLSLAMGKTTKLDLISDILLAIDCEISFCIKRLDKKTDAAPINTDWSQKDIIADIKSWSSYSSEDAIPDEIFSDRGKGEIVRPRKHLSSYEEGYMDGIHAAADSLGGEIKHITLGDALINRVTQEDALALMNRQRINDIGMIENLTKVKE